MRFMILVKASRASEAGEMPEESLFSEMAAYHEELAAAGALVDAAGLQPSSAGWRVRYVDGARTIVDGPFAESKELVAGFTIIETDSVEAARQWSERFPNPSPGESTCEIEVRRLFTLDDFEPGPGIDRFRELDAPSQR